MTVWMAQTSQATAETPRRQQECPKQAARMHSRARNKAYSRTLCGFAPMEERMSRRLSVTLSRGGERPGPRCVGKDFVAKAIEGDNSEVDLGQLAFNRSPAQPVHRSDRSDVLARSLERRPAPLQLSRF